MAQYCTLQEAYNVPSFARKKKSCKDPATLTDSYDPYTEQKGREQALYEKFTSEGIAPPTSQRGLSEDNTALDGGRKTYTSQMQDFNYMCRTAGICLPGEKRGEGFASYEEVPQAPPAQVRAQGPQAPKKAPTQPGQSCAPLNPPNYEYPISDLDKEKFKKAVNIALEEMEDGGATNTKYVPPAYEVRKVDMDKVTGYVDEELESYMTIHEMKATPTPKPAPIPQEKLRDIPGEETPKKASPASPLIEDIEAQKKKLENFTKKNKIWMDLLLFIGSGILIIFLLEQLFKLAMMTGMKKTVEALEMIIQESKGKAGVAELPGM